MMLIFAVMITTAISEKNKQSKTPNQYIILTLLIHYSQKIYNSINSWNIVIDLSVKILLLLIRFNVIFTFPDVCLVLLTIYYYLPFASSLWSNKLHKKLYENKGICCIFHLNQCLRKCDELKVKTFWFNDRMQISRYVSLAN